MRELAYLDLGRRAYGPVLEIQRRVLARVQREGDSASRLLLVEHDPPVITMGRRTRSEHLLASAGTLAASGVKVFRIRRGGDVTFHGPGQLVAYPIISLARGARPVHAHVRDLEEVTIATLRNFGIASERKREFPGVWVGDEKIAAIGVAVDKWVVYHGLALNVGADLSGFDLIVPCGLDYLGVTSVSRILGRDVPMDEIKPVLLECIEKIFGVKLIALPPDELINGNESSKTSASAPAGVA